MRSTEEQAPFFQDACRYWQTRFGLTDWTITYKTEQAKTQDEADVDYDCDTRHATITFFVGVEDPQPFHEAARHEIIHLLFADMLLAAIASRCESDPIMVREEHKVIERLQKVLLS